PPRDVAVLALERRLAGFRPQANGCAGREPQFLHVLGVHHQRVHDRLVVGTVLADVDLHPLLVGANRDQDEPLARHRFASPGIAILSMAGGEQKASPIHYPHAGARAAVLTVTSVEMEDTFAEASPMTAARVLVTAETPAWARTAGQAATGYAASVIGCDAE